MSNVSKLSDAGLIDPSQLSDEHKDIIENQLSDDEVTSLISVQNKFGGVGTMHSEAGENAGPCLF